jgi:hypothetical protein
LVLCSCIDFSAGRTIWQGVSAFHAAAFRGCASCAFKTHHPTSGSAQSGEDGVPNSTPPESGLIRARACPPNQPS